MPIQSLTGKAIADRISLRLLNRPSPIAVGEYYVGGNRGLFHLLGRALGHPIIQVALAGLGGYVAYAKMTAMQSAIAVAASTGIAYVAPEGSTVRKIAGSFAIGVGAGALLTPGLIQNAVAVGTIAGKQPWYTWIPIVGPTLDVLTGGGYGARSLIPQ